MCRGLWPIRHGQLRNRIVNHRRRVADVQVSIAFDIDPRGPLKLHAASGEMARILLESMIMMIVRLRLRIFHDASLTRRASINFRKQKRCRGRLLILLHYLLLKLRRRNRHGVLLAHVDLLGYLKVRDVGCSADCHARPVEHGA